MATLVATQPISKLPPSTPSSRTETHLINLSQTMIYLLNSRNWASPFFTTHVSQNVYTELQGKVTTGLAPFINNYKSDADRSPGFSVDVERNGTAMVDEEKGCATVILTQVLTGFEDKKFRGMAKAGSILLSWRRARGKWVCGSATMIYGSPEFLA